jgi:hypothetical protein
MEGSIETKIVLFFLQITKNRMKNKNTYGKVRG